MFKGFIFLKIKCTDVALLLGILCVNSRSPPNHIKKHYIGKDISLVLEVSPFFALVANYSGNQRQVAVYLTW